MADEIIHVLMLNESAIQKPTKFHGPHCRRATSTGLRSWFVSWQRGDVSTTVDRRGRKVDRVWGKTLPSAGPSSGQVRPQRRACQLFFEAWDSSTPWWAVFERQQRCRYGGWRAKRFLISVQCDLTCNDARCAVRGQPRCQCLGRLKACRPEWKGWFLPNIQSQDDGVRRSILCRSVLEEQIYAHHQRAVASLLAHQLSSVVDHTRLSSPSNPHFEFVDHINPSVGGQGSRRL